MHLSEFTQLMELGQIQATSELPTSGCLSQGDSCLGNGGTEVRESWGRLYCLGAPIVCGCLSSSPQGVV